MAWAVATNQSGVELTFSGIITLTDIEQAVTEGDDLFLGSGTSQAAAAVSASAAGIFEEEPTLTPDEMKVTLIASPSPASTTSNVAPTGATWSGGGWV